MVKSILAFILAVAVFVCFPLQAFAEGQNKTLEFEYSKIETARIDGFLIYCDGEPVVNIDKEDAAISNKDTNYYQAEYPESCADTGLSSYSVKELAPNVGITKMGVKYYDFSKFQLMEKKAGGKGASSIVVMKDEVVEIEVIPISQVLYVSTLTGLSFYLFAESEIAKISGDTKGDYYMSLR